MALRKFMAAVVLLSAFMKALTKLMVASCTSPVLALMVAWRKLVIASITWVGVLLGGKRFNFIPLTVLNGGWWWNKWLKLNRHCCCCWCSPGCLPRRCSHSRWRSARALWSGPQPVHLHLVHCWLSMVNTCKRKTKVVFEAGTSISPSPSQPPGGKFAPGRCNTWSSKQITNRWLQIKPHLRPRNCRRNASRESHHTLESWSTFYSVAPIWQFRNNGGRSTVPPNLKAGYYQMRKNIIWYVQSSVRIPD